MIYFLLILDFFICLLPHVFSFFDNKNFFVVNFWIFFLAFLMITLFIWLLPKEKLWSLRINLRPLRLIFLLVLAYGFYLIFDGIYFNKRDVYFRKNIGQYYSENGNELIRKAPEDDFLNFQAKKVRDISGFEMAFIVFIVFEPFSQFVKYRKRKKVV